ncbi:serine/threonine-protein kinase [Mycolicibacterium sp. lyk4-40-TYG-92]|uniref:serine/threonine-protein kinase n=1 Tax=Mycolicibacterium sp. lyk4-40-TYG-92 TaxID=3040295 RepID=UPI00254BA7C7|nr:serine/threonine-protein kinase [Mycolicibacterium sp. lyk4-40-TYG-92]
MTSTFNPGDIVAGYTIESVLGVGGMGVVYKAKNPQLPRSDALKVLTTSIQGDGQFRERFLREANVAATLDHPNIVAVYSRGETEAGQLWIAMQYVAGTDADQEVRSGRMSPARAARIITEVAKALDYAHRRGIMHRDVKPANFLLANADDPGDDERVFLADFGIARAFDDAAHLTTDGSVMASIAYAPPEALSGQHVDSRADVYSLACSFFVLLTGKTPYGGLPGGIAAIAAAHVTGEIPRVTDRVPHLPWALNEVIARGMAKDPNARYQTAREFAAAATAAVANSGPAPHAPRQLPPPGAQSWPPRQPTPPSGVLTYPSGQFSGPYPPGPPRGQMPPQMAAPRPPSTPPNSSRKRRLVIGAGVAAVITVIVVVASILLIGKPAAPTYTAQSFTHAHGSTEITKAPTAVAALGPGDADAVLSLGLQPVAIAGAGKSLPSWLQSKITGNPSVKDTVGFIDTSAIQAAKPDVIIATGDIDDATYQRLAAIAPTVTQPKDTSRAWNWQTQLKWIGKIVGRDREADNLINQVASQQTDLKNQNPQAAGKSVQVIHVSDDGVSQTLTPSNAADYLSSLGLNYDASLRRQPGDSSSSQSMADQSKLFQVRTEVLVVVRTDKAAGNGGAAGLPYQLAAYRGSMIIVDDPNTVAALADPGGYLATEYLDTNFVPLMSVIR